MVDYTPLDISSLQKKPNDNRGLNIILITLVFITIAVIGFIVSLFISRF